MKTKFLISIIGLLLGINLAYSQSISIEKVKDLLTEKEISLDELQNQGGRVLLGEGSGAGLVMPYQKVLVVITEDEAILKNEILGTDFNGPMELTNLVSFEVQGAMFFKDQVKGIVYK